MRKVTKKEKYFLLQLIDSKAVMVEFTLENGTKISMSKKSFDSLGGEK